jgi:hypothetical protein
MSAAVEARTRRSLAGVQTRYVRELRRSGERPGEVRAGAGARARGERPRDAGRLGPRVARRFARARSAA